VRKDGGKIISVSRYHISSIPRRPIKNSVNQTENTLYLSIDFDVWKPYQRYAGAQGVHERPSKRTLRIDGSLDILDKAETSLWEIALVNMRAYLALVRVLPAIIFDLSISSFINIKEPLPSGRRREETGTFSVGSDGKLDGYFSTVDAFWLLIATAYALGNASSDEAARWVVENYTEPRFGKERKVEALERQREQEIQARSQEEWQEILVLSQMAQPQVYVPPVPPPSRSDWYAVFVNARRR